MFDGMAHRDAAAIKPPLLPGGVLVLRQEGVLSSLVLFSWLLTGHIYVTIQTEAQSLLVIKCHVLLAGDKGGRRACRRANRAANEGALASRSECANQRATAATAADPSPVALLVRASLCDHP
jgi:hypothetical protein